LPPHDDVEQQLSLHCRNRVHLQRYVQHCEKNKVQDKSVNVVNKEESIEENKSDSDSSNKGVENEDKNDVSDNGDDSSITNIQHEDEIKNDFDWSSLDTIVVDGSKNKEDSDTEKSVTSEPK
jgi:Mg-chelatase subunit ChlI